MHITKIELEDIKSHAHFIGEFQRGTTAIMGENGRGQNDHHRSASRGRFLIYLTTKKDDFVRARRPKKVRHA
jgi:hypothetical protein